MGKHGTVETSVSGVSIVLLLCVLLERRRPLWPKRKRENTSDTVERRIKEGRGTGRGVDYKPWLLVQDVPSQGLASRVKGVKTGRVHHLLSQLEHRCFLILDWSGRVTDIREQYPLLPLEETVASAESLGIKHPQDPKT